MSVYIENMKMPNFGYREIRIYPDGRVIEEDECGIDEVVGTAIPVQPHGRLIDADAVLLESGPYEYDEWCEWALDQYIEAPTIIPAEKDDKT